MLGLGFGGFEDVEARLWGFEDVGARLWRV